MKMLIGNRGSGTTTAMLLEASKFKDEALVVTCGEQNVQWLKEFCEIQGIDPPEITSWREFRLYKHKGKVRKIFIDNADLLLKGIIKDYCDGNLETFTVSLDRMEDRPKYTKKG